MRQRTPPRETVTPDTAEQRRAIRAAVEQRDAEEAAIIAELRAPGAVSEPDDLVFPPCPADCPDRCCDERVAYTAPCGCTCNQYHDQLTYCAEHQAEYDEAVREGERLDDLAAFGYYPGE
jgi:hypothetical protein